MAKDLAEIFAKLVCPNCGASGFEPPTASAAFHWNDHTVACDSCDRGFVTQFLIDFWHWFAVVDGRRIREEDESARVALKNGSVVEFAVNEETLGSGEHTNEYFGEWREPTNDPSPSEFAGYEEVEAEFGKGSPEARVARRYFDGKTSGEPTAREVFALRARVAAIEEKLEERLPEPGVDCGGFGDEPVEQPEQDGESEFG